VSAPICCGVFEGFNNADRQRFIFFSWSVTKPPRACRSTYATHQNRYLPFVSQVWGIAGMRPYPHPPPNFPHTPTAVQSIISAEVFSTHPR